MTGCALFPVRRSSTSVEINFYDLSYVKAAKHYKYGGQHTDTVPSSENSAKYGAGPLITWGEFFKSSPGIYPALSARHSSWGSP